MELASWYKDFNAIFLLR
jgi:lantibiotic modifying enzyme